MQQPGLPSGRLQLLPLPLTPEFWEERARRAQQGGQKGGQKQQHKRQQQQQQKQQQQVEAEEPQGTPAFPTLAESVKKGQPHRGVALSKQQQSVETVAAMKKPGKPSAPSSTASLPAEEVPAGGDTDGIDLRRALLRTWPGALDHIPANRLVSLPCSSGRARSDVETSRALQSLSAEGGATSHQAASLVLSDTPRHHPMTAAGRSAAAVGGKSELAGYLQIEYETLDGRRFFPTHQQLGYKEPQQGSRTNFQVSWFLLYVCGVSTFDLHQPVI